VSNGSRSEGRDLAEQKVAGLNALSWEDLDGEGGQCIDLLKC
jgi:hypothetical protein